MESAFAFPDDFIPERWYSRPELVRDERAFRPFGFGECPHQPHILVQLNIITCFCHVRPSTRRSSQQNTGNRQCVGKPLAHAELALVVTTLLRQYNIRFAPGYEPSTMWRDMRDQVTAQPGRVLCVFEPLG